MPCGDIENLAILIGDDLRPEGVTFLFARVDSLLTIIERRPWNGGLEAVNDRALDLVGRPGRR